MEITGAMEIMRTMGVMGTMGTTEVMGIMGTMEVMGKRQRALQVRSPMYMPKNSYLCKVIGEGSLT